MFSILRSATLALATAAAALAADYRLPEVRHALVSPDVVVLYHVDDSTTIAEFGDLRVELSELNEYGFPAFWLVEGVGPNPSTLETEWTDADGLLHRVRTPCGGRTAAGCAEWHRVQVRALLVVFPQRPANDDADPDSAR